MKHLRRATGYDALRLDAVRKRSEGGRSSHARMCSLTHNPRRTQHSARTTQSSPMRAIQCTHARTHGHTHDRTHAYHDWQDIQQRHAAARRGTKMERRRHSLAHMRAHKHVPTHANTAHPSPLNPIITLTHSSSPRFYTRTPARTLYHTQDMHAVIRIKSRNAMLPKGQRLGPRDQTGGSVLGRSGGWAFPALRLVTRIAPVPIW